MRVPLGSQVVVTFRKSAQSSVVSVGPRLPLHPATHRPAKDSASSDKSKRPSLWLPPQGLPVLLCPSFLSEQSAIPYKSNRPGLRHFPKVFGARPRAPPQIMLDASFGSFRRFRSLTPPPGKTSVPSATASGRPHSRRRLRLFPSVLRLLPAPGTEKGGRMKTRWVKGRDTGKGRGPGSRHLPPRVGRVEEKKGRSRGKPRKAARDQSSQRVEGARRRCGGWQRGSMRLRRIAEGGVRDVLLRLREGRCEARFLTARGGPVPEPPARVRETFLPPGKARPSRRLRPSLPDWRSNRVSAPASLHRAGAAGNYVDTSERRDLTLSPPGGRADGILPGMPGTHSAGRLRWRSLSPPSYRRASSPDSPVGGVHASFLELCHSEFPWHDCFSPFYRCLRVC